MTFTGCHKNQTVAVSTSSLNLRVEITYGEAAYEGILKSDKNGNCEFSFLEPDSLEGFSLCVEEGNVTMKYMGLEYNIPQSDLTESFFLVEIYDALKALPDKTAVALTNEQVIYEGVCNGRAYTLEFDTEGRPRSLSVKSMNLEVEFYRF